MSANRVSIALIVVITKLFFCQSSLADVIVLNDGKVVTGEIIQRSETGVLIKLEYGTFTYPQTWIKDVQKESVAATNQSLATNRIPPWGKIVSTLAQQSWANELKQIPATVIETGVLNKVPYVSFHCNNGGYELNIYGDLDNPACVEIGVLNYLLKNDRAKSNCVELISSLLPRSEDKGIVRKLKWDKDVVEKEGLTFEITLPTEPDAYGGWWVSVYDKGALNVARASGSELLAISEPRVAQPATVTRTPSPPSEPSSAWDDSDLKQSRKVSEYSGYSGGRVYVRSYYRKDGTYVRAHTRSRPRR